MAGAVPGPAADVVALQPALHEAAEWAGAMLHRLGDAASVATRSSSVAGGGGAAHG